MFNKVWVSDLRTIRRLSVSNLMCVQDYIERDERVRVDDAFSRYEMPFEAYRFWERICDKAAEVEDICETLTARGVSYDKFLEILHSTDYGKDTLDTLMDRLLEYLVTELNADTLLGHVFRHERAPEKVMVFGR